MGSWSKTQSHFWYTHRVRRHIQRASKSGTVTLTTSPPTLVHFIFNTGTRNSCNFNCKEMNNDINVDEITIFSLLELDKLTLSVFKGKNGMWVYNFLVQEIPSLLARTCWDSIHLYKEAGKGNMFPCGPFAFAL